MRSASLHDQPDHLYCIDCGGERFYVLANFWHVIIGFECATDGCKNFIPLRELKFPGHNPDTEVAADGDQT